ncbi:MAG TPA: murein hydrolase activator EnvC [Rhizobiaceae bacterium]|nr:murein hydrolase activator EnvC [Rhizobiaceae bacterium]
MVTFFASSSARLLAALLLVTAVAWPASSADGDGTAELEARRVQSQEEYDRIAKEVVLSHERLAALSEEISTIRKDQASVTAALIQAAKTEKKLAQDVEDITDRLAGMKQQQEDLRQSLVARRDVLAEVLGALQRMGLNPPPALLVRPEDALSSVHSAILLGSVVPELRSETEILLADLQEMNRIAASIEAERGRLTATIGEQVAEKERLNLLLKEKEALQASSETALGEEMRKSEELAARSKDLKGLIASLEQNIAETRSAAERAREAEEARLRREAALAALPVPEGNRLVEAAPFSMLRGKLALPAAGRLSRRFGASDGNGGVMRGDTLATQSGAIVTAPADGSVLYAGPFRSYGQLLILNAGDGYHVVLAGMGRISVSLGQSVLAGEPVGTMGEARVASTTAFENGNTSPELYVEFRKDGKPVDPAPWWSERLSGRTGNDS